jgi:hypothetical protein
MLATRRTRDRIGDQERARESAAHVITAGMRNDGEADAAAHREAVEFVVAEYIERRRRGARRHRRLRASRPDARRSSRLVEMRECSNRQRRRRRRDTGV